MTSATRSFSRYPSGPPLRGDQIGRVALLDVLRQHQDGSSGYGGPQRDCRADPLIRPARRKPHVEDAQVGLGLRDGLVEVATLRQRRDHDVPASSSTTDEAFAQQRRSPRRSGCARDAHLHRGRPAGRAVDARLAAGREDAVRRFRRARRRRSPARRRCRCPRPAPTASRLLADAPRRGTRCRASASPRWSEPRRSRSRRRPRHPGCSARPCGRRGARE